MFGKVLSANMFNIFQNTARPEKNLFFKKDDANDLRLGEIVSFEAKDYENSEIVILGCPQDEGVARNQGRIGAALAPKAIRTQFYKLTDFGISVRIFDLGDTKIQTTLEETHDLQTKIVARALRDGKRLIVLGGGNDISYADGAAAAKVFGSENWAAFNIDAHFDVRADFPRNSGTPYRQLLEEKLVRPENFYEIGYQPQVNSSSYFHYLQNLSVNLISLEELRGSSEWSTNERNYEKKISSALENRRSIFWGLDVDSVRAADAPGVSASNPAGLTAEEFIRITEIAAMQNQTRVIEFTEMNPSFDIDNRTAKLVAIAMQRFCAKTKKSQPENG